jgi:adenosylcobinamide kinase/adenosylcobinamide-phosphate guanylyltransferase
VITLVLGGTRSGKSEIAEGIAAKLPAPILYFATAHPEGDDDLHARVERHRNRRPADWTTIEAGTDLVRLLQTETRGTALVDALGPWVASHAGFEVDADALIAALTQREGDAVVVSEEVGLGVHPSTESGRQFRDALGDVNRAVAAVADEVLLVVAGRVLTL